MGKKIDLGLLKKAATDEQVLVEALQKIPGVTLADRTVGDAQTNRKKGDTRFVVNGRTCSIELQVSPKEKNNQNFSLSLSKKAKFQGHSGEVGDCYYMFGNDTTEDFMIVAKEYVDEKITEYDYKNKEVIVFMKPEFVVISPSGLAASGECLGYGKTIIECVEDFSKHLQPST